MKLSTIVSEAVMGEPPVYLIDPARSGDKPTRGHQYWQKRQTSESRSRKSTIRESIPTNLLNRITSPDALISTTGSHSFLYSTDTGLLVDPEECQGHADWCDRDDTVAQLIEHGSPIAGRYARLFNIPTIVFWYFETDAEANLLKPAAQALLQVLPADSVAIVGIDRETRHITTLRDILGHSKISRSRGHQYWQKRQTSESRSN